MLVNKKDSLKGKDNKRLTDDKPTNRESSAAWQDKDTEYKVDEVNKPALERVVDAKDWVDNGSKL